MQQVKCHKKSHISVQTFVITVEGEVGLQNEAGHKPFAMFVHLQKLSKLSKGNKHSLTKEIKN